MGQVEPSEGGHGERTDRGIPTAAQLRSAYEEKRWAELEALLWTVQLEGQRQGKRELVLRVQALTDWLWRQTPVPASEPSAEALSVDFLLEEVLGRLNHLSWTRESAREGSVGA